MKVTSLDGTWELLPVDEFKERYPEEGWLEMEVPSHWQQHPDIESHAGKVVYRKRFDFRRTRGKRYRLRLNGVFYRCAVYLNDVLLGRNEGYFFPQEYEITGLLRGRNTLLVEVECPDEEDKSEKTMITGVFSHWDALDPETNPGGIWLSVEIVQSGEIMIERAEVRLEELTGESARLEVHLVLDSIALASVEMRISAAPHNFAGQAQAFRKGLQLAGGRNEVSIPMELKRPRLWWCHDQGYPHLYRFTVEVRTPGVSAPSDVLELNYGVRTFEMRDWIAYLNGRRILLKGNNYGPGDTRLATMTPERFRQDLELAKDAHMNMLRLHAHVEHPAFYELADELGIMIWQDFPLQWRYSKALLPEALRQVGLMVRYLYNHPSVVIWCMHNEPGLQPEPAGRRWRWVARILFSLLFYNWNRDVMDSQLKEKVEGLDASRFVVRSSGEWGVPLLRKGTDSHLYYGWYREPGPGQKLVGLRERLRFVTEFGAQSFPNLESSLRFMAAELAQVDWNRLEERHSLQRAIMDKWVDAGACDCLEELIEASQEYQISVNRAYIDHLRFAKYRPTGGILGFSFHDSNPAVQWSIVDYWRVPKRSYHHMQRAFHPQYVFTLLERDRYAVGEEIPVPVYVVNDSLQAYDEVQVSAEIVNGDGQTTTSVSLSTTLGADCEVTLVRLLHFRFAEAGERRVRLTLEYGDEVFENEYPLLVGPR
ncbi:MAG TPA: glycoside hydrolase [Chloroflexi bacterium]|nr:glycoside hydrolase [Chloroflexota bacterium]